MCPMFQLGPGTGKANDGGNGTSVRLKALSHSWHSLLNLRLISLFRVLHSAFLGKHSIEAMQTVKSSFVKKTAALELPGHLVLRWWES